MTGVRATPFHGRAAAMNSANRWASRNGFTLAQDYGDASDEVLAARARAVIADISWRWRVSMEGPQSAKFLSHLLTRDVGALNPGQSCKALWLNDGGAVRGAGLAARFASDKFLIASAAPDPYWFAAAAAPFGVALQDLTEREGGLALIGPYAGAVLRAAGLDADIALLGFRKLFWRGLDITLSRWGEQDGFEIWCAADDCYLLWDRLLAAGASFGLQPAGLVAGDILDIEQGVARPARDYLPAGDGFAATPTPDSLGLESLVDEQHKMFNGRASWLANRGRSETVLVGVEIDSELAAPFAALQRNGAVVGHTLISVYSPVLRRAVALAQIDRSASKPDTAFTIALPVSLSHPDHRVVSARLARLPFVTFPDPISS